MTHRLLLGNLAALLLPLLMSSAQTPDFRALNAVFGASVWGDDNLWDDADDQVAERLQWPAESRTSSDSSYRLYAGSNKRIIGARPFSLALYGRQGMADRISMVFANKGDVGGVDATTHRVNNEYKKQIVADAKTIADSLTSVLGPAKTAQFGQGAKTRETVQRWDWNGHAILLAAPRGEYVAVRIVPTKVADGEAVARISDVAMGEQLKARVERRPNGDAVLKEIPMVNQGPKGYCVPATWERALRYMGIPADMYVLAMAAQTDAGGGTTLNSMRAGAGEAVSRSGRRLILSGGRVTARSMARFIDEGMPILWGMFVVSELDQNISNRSAQRREVKDWATYKQMLKPWRQSARSIHTDRENGHMCMVIGYNEDTGEIAISDSWGPQFAERWITEEEANAISQGDFTVIGR